MYIFFRSGISSGITLNQLTQFDCRDIHIVWSHLFSGLHYSGHFQQVTRFWGPNVRHHRRCVRNNRHPSLVGIWQNLLRPEGTTGSSTRARGEIWDPMTFGDFYNFLPFQRKSNANNGQIGQSIPHSNFPRTGRTSSVEAVRHGNEIYGISKPIYDVAPNGHRSADAVWLTKLNLGLVFEK